MNLRPKKKAKVVPAPSTTHEPDITVKPEQELALLKILKSGSMFLGDIRRDIGLSPFVIAAILKAKPRVFVGWEDESGRYRVGLRAQMADAQKQADNRVLSPDLDAKLSNLIQEAGHLGISIGRLWGRWHIQTRASEDYARRNADKIAVVERKDVLGKLKRFLVWRDAVKPTTPVPVQDSTPNASQQSPSVVIADAVQTPPKHAPSIVCAMDKDQLLHLLEGGPRDVDGFLTPRYGIDLPRIRDVCREFPELRIRYQKRFDSPLSDYCVSLEPPAPEPLPEPKAANAPTFEMPQLTPSDWERMKWKPGARHAAKPYHPEHRTRHALPI